jgi:hypothetical protein
MRSFSALLSALIAVSTCPEALAEKRVALVYQNAAPQRLGFEVVETVSL